jgi:hypothetical protein
VWKFVVGGGLAHLCFVCREAGESRYITTTAIRCNPSKDITSLDAVATSGFFPLLIKLSLNFLLFCRLRALDVLGGHIAAAHLPFHELVECTLWIGAELLIGAFLGYATISIDADNAVGPFDR